MEIIYPVEHVEYIEPNYIEQGVNPCLSELLLTGRRYHELCRDTFVEKVQVGYYAYERRNVWRTCAVAAAYAGAFGAESIERDAFSYSMAVFRLSKLVGYNIKKVTIPLPSGEIVPLDEAMIRLVDEHYWTRQGVAEMLMDYGL